MYVYMLMECQLYVCMYLHIFVCVFLFVHVFRPVALLTISTAMVDQQQQQQQQQQQVWTTPIIHRIIRKCLVRSL